MPKQSSCFLSPRKSSTEKRSKSSNIYGWNHSSYKETNMTNEISQHVRIWLACLSPPQTVGFCEGPGQTCCVPSVPSAPNRQPLHSSCSRLQQNSGYCICTLSPFSIYRWHLDQIWICDNTANIWAYLRREVELTKPSSKSVDESTFASTSHLQIWLTISYKQPCTS